ncbi:nucleotide sugar dehydrogenase [Haloarcula montana]|uniref:nucleotide sugar dehydrogenase n=1 Tax=Haloarcula montana TaxID=3111776 RepID=UPI002D798CB6|nr:nucleotide sugar dehydrogenase [Haloarcula sp. GH36]
MSETVADRPGLYGAESDTAAQRTALTSGDIPVAVYGLGKMGLPLAGVYADVTGNTVGVDVDPAVVERINGGTSPIQREPGLEALVAETVEDGSLWATTDGDAAADAAAVHVVMVPTLLTTDKEPDLSILDEVVSTIATGLSPGDVVIVESTVPPRTTVDRVRPTLLEESDLEAGEFGVAACPERTVSGQALADIRGTHPKVVGGVDEESTRVATLIYDAITDNEVLATTDAATAEAVKVFEGIYRDANIAIANQLALYAQEMDIDVNEGIDVANTQPFCDLHDPGPGVGGHCIPVYPYFLSGQFDADASVLTAARERNDGMPAFTASMVEAILDDDGVDAETADVLLLGVTYKANIAELRNSPSIPLADELGALGATVWAVDPLVEDWSELEPMRPRTVDEIDGVSPDVVVLATPHEEFTRLDWERFDAPILDGRGVIDTQAVETPVYTVGGRWP